MILRFYDVSTGPTQPWCSTSQEQQPAGSRHPESRSREVTMPRPMAVRCCAVSSQGLAATLSCAAGFALCDAQCAVAAAVVLEAWCECGEPWPLPALSSSSY